MSDAVSESQPLPPALTVGERILEHLRTTTPYPPMDKEMARWPFSRTQQGIAEALGFTRSHVGLECKRLQAAGYIDRVLRHIDASPARRPIRRPVYFLGLTPPVTIYNAGFLKPLALSAADVMTLRIVLFRCPNCGSESRVALKEAAT